MDPKSPDSVFRQWRDAQERASHAEGALFDACLRSINGTCAPPSMEQWQNAKQLRAVATELFQRAMKEVSEANGAAAKLVGRGGGETARRRGLVKGCQAR